MSIQSLVLSAITVTSIFRVLPTRWRRKPASIDTERNYVTVTICIDPRATGPRHTLAASVLPLVSNFECMPDGTDRQTDGRTDTGPTTYRFPLNRDKRIAYRAYVCFRPTYVRIVLLCFVLLRVAR